MAYFSRISSFLSRIDPGLIFAAGLSLFAVQALLQPGLPTSADLTIHIYRALEFEQSWAPGVIVPRWSPNLAYGYGYPLFLFAPPLPYFLAMLFHLPGVTMEIAFKGLLTLGVLLYAGGMYLLARDLLRSTPAGLVAAVAYTFAPFALREALHYGGNVPQYLAIGLFPWTLWAATRAVSSGRWRWTVLTAFFYAAIMLSHLFHALIFSPVLGLYLLLMVAIDDNNATGSATTWPRRLWQATKPLLAIPIGLLLSAFFWIPAFTERHATRAQVNIYLEKSPFFIRYPYWPELVAWINPLDTRAANPYIPLTLGVVTLILAGLGLPASIIAGRQKSDTNQGIPYLFLPTLFFAGVAAAATFMSLPLSQPVWEVVEILQVAEFPWRMLGLANLGLAVPAGAAVLLIPRKSRWVAAGGIIAIQLLAVAPYLYPVIGFVRIGEPTIAGQINYERTSQSIGTTTLGEYLPQSVSRPPTTSPLVETFLAGKYPERLDRNSLPNGADAILLEQTAITHRYKINTSHPFTLRLFHFDFPGWQATLDNRPTSITPEAETGLMLIDVPAGQHTLTVHFGETPGRVITLSLTGLTIIGLAVIGMWQISTNSKPPKINSRQQTATPSVNSMWLIIGVALIVAAALWLTPRLKPYFTVNSPPERVVTAQHQTNFRFANNIQLVGYDISQKVVKPEGYLQVTLYWQTDSAPYQVNLQPFVHLDRLNDFTTVADATNYTPGDVTTETNMPTFHWDNARYVRDEHDLIIPPNTPPLAYAVRVGLIDPAQGNQPILLADSNDDTIWLDTINVSPGRKQPPPPEQPLNIQFNANGDSINLTGFELTGITPKQLDFTLAWQSNKQPQNNYTIFAQLLDPDGNLITSFDRPPLNGAYPTATWLPQQTILDPRTIPLDNVPAGTYTLVVGLYNSDTGQRMVTDGGSDFVTLTTVGR